MTTTTHDTEGAMTLLTIYARATDEQRARGRAWYPTYLTAARRIARETGCTLRRTVAVAAITSPDCQVSTNLAFTRKACAGGGSVAAGRYPNAMRARYAPILAGEISPLDGVGGDKVTAFYRAILGDTDAVVLDRWALRAAGHGRDTATPLQYRRIADQYRAAAAQVGETPRDFQAIVWTVLREGMTRADGAAVRLVDIHEIGG